MKRFHLLSAGMTTALVALLSFSACSGDDGGSESPKEIEKTNVQGIIEKGPFVQGSKVTLYELNADLSQTGKSFKTQTNSDLGGFSFGTPIQLSSQYVELETSGYFYNEVKGELSASQITLNALSDLSNRSTINVNLITHLEYERVKHLVQEGKTFSAAKTQAEKELLTCFAITDIITSPEDVSITDNSKNSAMLLAISTIMLYDKSEAEFSEFIAKFSTDFADNGEIDNDLLRTTIAEGENHAHPSEVIEKMQQFYEQKGVTLKCDDFSRFIDFNGDGVIDENDGEDLEEIAPTYVAEETFFGTEANAQSVLASAYAQTALFEAYQLTIEAVRLGKIDGSAYGINLSNPSDATIQKAWEAAYTAVQRTHMMIYALQHSHFGYDSSPYLAEAYALRAFLGYNLTVLWGNVPYVDETRGYEYREDYLQTYGRQYEQREVLQFALDAAMNAVGFYQHTGSASTFSSSPTFHLADKSCQLLQAEIEQTLNSPDGAYWSLNNMGDFGSNDCFFIADDAEIEWPLAYKQNLYRAGKQPIYDAEYLQHLTEEANAYNEQVDKNVVAENWLNATNRYGVWAALKRLGVAQSMTGCQAHELLLPIPTRELLTNPSLRQNAGY